MTQSYVYEISVNCSRRTEGFSLRSSGNQHLTLIGLKQRLFAWHKDSFYGTLLDVEESDSLDGSIVLPDRMALSFMAEGIHRAALNIDPGEELQLCMDAAPIMLRCLEEGRYAPDYRQWHAGGLGWKLMPDGEDAMRWLEVSERLGTDGRGMLEDWLNGIFAGLAAADGPLKEAWEKVKERYSLLQMTGDGAVSMDEGDWLIAIGWKKDTVPFQIALRLVEPLLGFGEEEKWSLEVVVIDRDDPSSIFILPSGDVAFAGVEDVPVAWLSILPERLEKERSRWLQAVPELAGTDGEGSLKLRLGDDEAWSFLTEGSIRLAEAGSNILLPAWWDHVRKQKLRLKAKVRSSVGSKDGMFSMDSIIAFDWRLAVGNVSLSEEEFGKLAEHNRRLIQVNGQWLMLNPAILEQIRTVMGRLQKKKGLSFREAMELHLLGGRELGGGNAELQEGIEAENPEDSLRLEVELNEHLSRMVGQLHQTSAIPLIDDPHGFHGELRRYQREGVSWLVFLRRFGLGGCLADDMGLGKTIQWICYLLYLKEQGLLSAPALLICPTSVIGNWEKELKRFAPDLRVHLHYGARRSKGEEFTASVADADVVITSYTLSHMDEEELGSLTWGSLCLDEAQNIKNAYTKQAGAARKLDALHRVALTGTPIENRLTELWSIYDFINPGYLGSIGEFTRSFVTEVEKGNQERIDQVQRLVHPFLLRRLKKDPSIQLDLPEKNEMKTYVPLTLEQGAAYESVLQDMFAQLDQLAPMERRGLILATLTRLKQVCDHPVLLNKQEVIGAGGEAVSKERRIKAGKADGGLIRQSSKLVRLLEMVEELRSEGDKCLIFTQYVGMGHLLQQVLQELRKEPVLFLHGGVPKVKRDEMIAQFQQEADGTGIFVLSLKAGGTGLNLTAANHVFHFDRWWNPAVENQATDRAFRIGQTRDVQVHKFISLGTLEERIDEMLENKQGLSQQIIGSGEGWITELSTDELRELFALRREWLQE